MATAVERELRLPGHPALTVHDNYWANGERDLVLYKPDVVPEMPAALSNPHNRLRTGVALDQAFDRSHPDLPVVDLDDPQDEQRLQHALFFPAEDEESPVLAFTHFRVVPVLRHIGWLTPQSG
ncbi:hypothetical protein [Streptomyces sp. NPDC051636]|uniref:hypothetical protein n=1 Tax=Streptomyces sp. NPDC051636 TaxID=3365663 RepID=UPI0037B05888